MQDWNFCYRIYIFKDIYKEFGESIDNVKKYCFYNILFYAKKISIEKKLSELLEKCERRRTYIFRVSQETAKSVTVTVTMSISNLPASFDRYRNPPSCDLSFHKPSEVVCRKYRFSTFPEIPLFLYIINDSKRLLSSNIFL